MSSNPQRMKRRFAHWKACLFQKFRKLDYDGQSQYLSQIISLQEPKLRKVEENISGGHYTVKYSINGIQYRGANNYLWGWKLTSKIENQLNAVETDVLRRSCRLSRLDHIRNDMIRERTCTQDTIVNRVERRQLVRYGHVMRMADERWPKKMVSYIPSNRRKRGRPKTSWRKGIEEATRKREMNEGDWENRREWRLMCEKW
ncbi:unnamed protein product [Acanthoscelides obtectus]|uniref:Endonuclease-reverse transcriptase n=1 Tax=Acanthoscelides obtectus TaxID=200917 RepID=A0A9P0LQA9_ACAOB|nr:unnamed protein product [Acanthoscelides obtectus]CAK1634907.1 hypothetical protein AOBTE_LOCUS8956 [Acanthoscelides obtectus]